MGTRRANGSGSIFKRNGWYYYKRIDENGTVFCRSLKTKIKAEAEEASKDFETGEDLPKKARLAALQEYLKPKSSNPTFDEAWDAYVKHPRNVGQRQKTQSEDKSVLSYLVTWLHGHDVQGSRRNKPAKYPKVMRLGEITSAMATEFIHDATKENSPRNLNRYIRVCKRIWNFNNMETNPWNDFKKFPEHPHRRRSLTKDEVLKLIDAAEGELKTIFTIGPYTGLRMSDCAKLRWEEFNKDLTILTRQPDKTKNSSGKIVNIPVGKKLRERLSELKRTKTGFVTPGLAAIPNWDLSDLVQSHFKKCGLDEWAKCENYRNKTVTVGFHSFRSYFITELANNGAPLALTQSIVGHMSPELTQLYYRADTERARKFIDQL